MKEKRKFPWLRKSLPKNESSLEQATEESLHALLDQGDDMETILARYPDWQSELRPRLQAAAWLKEKRKAILPRG